MVGALRGWSLAARVLGPSHRCRLGCGLSAGLGRGLARAVGRVAVVSSVPRVVDLCQSEAKNDSRSGGKCLVQDHCALRQKSSRAIICRHTDDFDWLAARSMRIVKQKQPAPSLNFRYGLSALGLQLMNGAIGGAQAPAQFTSDGGHELDGCRRRRLGKASIVRAAHAVTNQFDIGDNGRRARFLIENSQFTKHRSRGKCREPDVGAAWHLQIGARRAACRNQDFVPGIPE